MARRLIGIIVSRATHANDILLQGSCVFKMVAVMLNESFRSVHRHGQAGLGNRLRTAALKMVMIATKQL